MKFHLALILLGTSALAAAAAPPITADDNRWQYIYPNASVVMGMDWQSIANSDFAQTLQQQFAGYKKTVGGDASFIERFDSAIMSGPTSTGNPSMRKGVIAMRGKFDLAKLKSAIRAQSGQMQLYNGIEVYTAKNMSVAIVSPDMWVAGDASSVMTALRNRERNTNGEMLAKAQQLATTSHAWLVAASDGSDMKLPGVKTMSASLTVHHNAELAMHLDTDTSQRATSLANVVNGMAGMQTPGLPIQVQADQKRVNVTASITPEQIKQQMTNIAGLALSRLSGMQSGDKAALARAKALTGTPAAPASIPVSVAPTPAPNSEKNVIKIYGMEGGTKEIDMTAK